MPYDPDLDEVNPPFDTADLPPHLFKEMQGNVCQQWIQWAMDDAAWNSRYFAVTKLGVIGGVSAAEKQELLQAEDPTFLCR